jgi:hypothetical protein
MNSIVLQPGAMSATVYLDGLTIYLPQGAVWNGGLGTAGTSAPVILSGTAYTTGTNTYTIQWTDANHALWFTPLTLIFTGTAAPPTVPPTPPPAPPPTTPPTILALLQAAEQVGKLYNSHGASVICTGSINNVPLGKSAVTAFQNAWNAAAGAGTLVGIIAPSYPAFPTFLATNGTYDYFTAHAFIRFATAARFYPQFIPPPCPTPVTTTVPPPRRPVPTPQNRTGSHGGVIEGLGDVGLGSTITVTAGQSGKTIQMSVGDTLVVELPQPPNTFGYKLSVTGNVISAPVGISEYYSFQGVTTETGVGTLVFTPNYILVPGGPAAPPTIVFFIAVSPSQAQPTQSGSGGGGGYVLPPARPGHYLEGVKANIPAPQSPIALGYRSEYDNYDGVDSNVYVSEWGRYGNVMAGGRYGGPNGGGFRDDFNYPQAKHPVEGHATGVGAMRRFAVAAAPTDLSTITNAVPTFNQILSLLKGQTDPTDPNVKEAVLALMTGAAPLAASTAAVASTLTAPPASVSTATTQASSAASDIASILAQFTAGTATAAGVAQLLTDTQALGSGAIAVLSAYYAQVVINDGCPGVPADITNFQNALNLVVTTHISSVTAIAPSGVLDTQTIAAINAIYPGQAPNCTAIVPPPIVPTPPLPPSGPTGGPPPTPPPPTPVPTSSTTTTVLTVVGVVAALGAIGGLVYAINKKPMKNPVGSFGPEDDDYIIQDSRYGGYDVYQGRKGIGHYPGMNAALRYIHAHMEHEQFYPNIFYVNERGNIDLLDQHGNIIESRV